MNKKHTFISLILAGILTLSGCNQPTHRPFVFSGDYIVFEDGETILIESDETTNAPPTTDPPAVSTTTVTTTTATSADTYIETTTAAPVTTTISTTTETTTTPPQTTTTTTAVTTIPEDNSPPDTQATRLGENSSKLVTSKRDLNNEAIYYFNNLKSTICSFKTRYKYFYNFNTKMSTGMTDDGYLVPIETDLYGIKAKISGKNKISVKVYNNSKQTVSLSDSYIENVATSDTGIYLKNKLAMNKSVTIDASTLNEFNKRPKFWRFVANLKIGKSIKTTPVYLYFVTNMDETKLCMLSNEVYTTKEINQLKDRRAKVVAQIKKDKIDPKKQLDVIGTIYYPHWDFGDPKKYRCDTERWAKLAKTLVTDSMSDELKVWTFYNWLINNIAYDDYRANGLATGDGLAWSRSYANNDYSGTWHVYNTKTGVCNDFTNIMTIFCRTCGIPTIDMNTYSHVWNAVYLNGRWIEIDCTRTCKYAVEGKDTSVRTKAYWADDHRYDFDASATGRIKEDDAFDPVNEGLPTNKTNIG